MKSRTALLVESRTALLMTLRPALASFSSRTSFTRSVRVTIPAGLLMLALLVFAGPAGSAPVVQRVPGSGLAHTVQQTGSSQHMHDVEHRGDQAMGFDHTKTTHHFLLSASGGSIQVTADDPEDSASRDQIRMHLAHIAKMFSEGNFEIPMFVHDQTPPGAATMKQLKADIAYKYVEIEHGAKVVISSENPAAISAIHDFFAFQIKDHHTGDSLDVSR